MVSRGKADKGKALLFEQRGTVTPLSWLAIVDHKGLNNLSWREAAKDSRLGPLLIDLTPAGYPFIR